MNWCEVVKWKRLYSNFGLNRKLHFLVVESFECLNLCRCEKYSRDVRNIQETYHS